VPRLVRLLELVALFVAAPLAIRLGLVPLPKLLVLLLATGGCLFSLRRDRGFDRRCLLDTGALRRALGSILLRAAVGALLIAGLVGARRGMLFELPRTRPLLYALVLVLYPVVSALPQELLYRVFFFRRYSQLLGDRWTVAGSALAFALLHIIYADPLAPLLTLPAGLVLAVAYRRNRSLPAVALEHALYGIAVFSLGLGRTFFVPAA